MHTPSSGALILRTIRTNSDKFTKIVTPAQPKVKFGFHNHTTSVVDPRVVRGRIIDKKTTKKTTTIGFLPH